MDYIQETEVAKMAKNILRKAYPATKFSVRTSKYAGGSSIHVSWKDGATQEAIEKLISYLHGSDFDGMQDLKYNNGKPYANDFIFAERHYSLPRSSDILKYFDLNNGYPKDMKSLINAGVDSLRGFYSCPNSWNYTDTTGSIFWEKLDNWQVSRLQDAYQDLGFKTSVDLEKKSLTISI